MSMHHLYPEVTVAFQDYSKAKRVVVPNQSMTLKEILQRFVRRESLPAARDGVYNDQLGDLEKLRNEDITVQMERVTELKSGIKKATARMKKKRDAEIAAELAKAVSQKAEHTPADTPHPGSAAV